MAASAFLSTMQAIIVGDPVFVAPLAEGVPYPTLESWIAIAVVELDSTRWGALYTKAVAYLAAHEYAMGPGRASAGGASAGGSVAEKRARNWSLRFNPPSGAAASSDEGLTQTSYGLTFLRLRRMTKAPFLIKPSNP